MIARKISIATVEELCKLGDGEEQCKYFGMNDNEFVCMKFSSFAIVIDKMEFTKTGLPKGDNCDGYGSQSKTK